MLSIYLNFFKNLANFLPTVVRFFRNTAALAAATLSLIHFWKVWPIVPEVQTKPTFHATTCFARRWGAVSIIWSSEYHMWFYLFCGYNIQKSYFASTSALISLTVPHTWEGGWVYLRP